MASSSRHRASIPSPSSFGSRSMKWNYDVFLSFRGEDTRMNFVDHLYTALTQKGINTFRDDENLERGEEISHDLSKAIIESRFAIIIFSENYASSTWCLDELVQIIDSTKETGQIAYPVFYNVDPSNVRNQKESFAKAFGEHEKKNLGKMKMEKVQKWREALSRACKLSGWDSRERHESKIIQEIVEEIFYKLSHALLHVDDNLVGMDYHVNEMNILLSRGSNDVKFVGIHGLGGIGKTTIAKVVYNQISYQFEGCSYLANIRANYEKKGDLVSFQEQLLYDILKVRDLKIGNDDMGSAVIKDRLKNKKVLIILDDVDHISQLEKLAANEKWFGLGSRIIITTRDQHLLNSCQLVQRYEVRECERDKSLEIFSWKAFKNYHPPEDYKELSNNVVNYAKDLPLALTVLGSYLHGRSKDAWKDAMDQLKVVPNEEIISILKISYEGLNPTQKDVFLDIACFFNGQDKDKVIKILDSCGFFPSIVIPVLIDKSLITISNDNMLRMHDLVQDMGRHIVCQESPKNPKKRSRLWTSKDICQVLAKNAGTKAIEGIQLVRGWSNPDLELSLNAEVFVKMKSLRFLSIYDRDLRMHFPEGVSKFPDELKILEWEGYPLAHLPVGFQPDKLVHLCLHRSRLIKLLWNGRKVLEHLKSIDLSYSQDLTDFPDVTVVPNLERLALRSCRKLVMIHPSVWLHKRLKYLNLYRCKNLGSFPYKIEMESLETLILSECLKMKKFPEVHGNMKRLSQLHLDRTAIRELPSSIENFTSLTLLYLNYCTNLVRLPSSVCKLKYLEKLFVSGCSTLEKLPEDLGNLKSLVWLHACRTALKEVPASINSLGKLRELLFVASIGLKLPSLIGLSSLTVLNLRGCNLTDETFPSHIDCLSSLTTLNLSENNFVSLPANIRELYQLTELDLLGCKRIQSIPELPSSISSINAIDCTSLTYVSAPTIFKSKFWNFRFINCINYVKSSCNMIDALLQFKRQVRLGNSEAFNICFPGEMIPEWFSYQYTGSLSIALPPNRNRRKLQGFAFCIVVGYTEVYNIEICQLFDCKFESSLADDGKITCLLNYVFLFIPELWTLKCDHVVLAYVSCERWLYGCTEVMFASQVEHLKKFKKCRIRPIFEDSDDSSSEEEKENDPTPNTLKVIQKRKKKIRLK